MSSDITPAAVAHIALLANLDVSAQEQQEFAQAFSATLDEVTKLSAVDTTDLEPTHHVTGLTNVWREDEVDQDRLISQAKALNQSCHNLRGYVVVDRVLEE